MNGDAKMTPPRGFYGFMLYTASAQSNLK